MDISGISRHLMNLTKEERHAVFASTQQFILSYVGTSGNVEFDSLRKKITNCIGANKTKDNLMLKMLLACALLGDIFDELQDQDDEVEPRMKVLACIVGFNAMLTMLYEERFPTEIKSDLH